LKFSSGCKQPVPSAGKRGQFFFAREKMKSMSCAGKHAIGAMHGKTYNPCQGRENIDPVLCAGKHGSRVKRRKTCNRCFVQEIARELIRIAVDLAFDWLKNFDCLHWLRYLQEFFFAPIIKLL